MLIKVYDKLDSTNYKIREKIESTVALKDSTNFVIVAKIQTEGYGTKNSKWESVSGNLHMSFDLCYEKQEYLPYIISYALFKTIKSYLNNSAKISIKWPNDILVNKKKIAGILIEEFADRYIIGIGVNLNYAPIDISTSISNFSDNVPNINTFISAFIPNLSKEMNELSKKGFLNFKRKWKDVNSI